MNTTLFVGTYANGGGPGLVPLTFDTARDRWTTGAPVAAIRNASFGVAAGDLIYLVDEAAGQVGIHAADSLARLATIDSGGAAPCHLAIDPAARWLAIANYESGSVALVPLDEAGMPAAAPAIRADVGRGPDVERQAGPHAHWVGFSKDGGRLFTIDLGADRIFARTVPDGPATLAYGAPPGSGPRHLAFHPRLPVAYLVSELAATVTLLRVQGDGFVADTILSTLPDGVVVDNLGGAIAVDAAGRRLYVTNRGHDSIASVLLADDGAMVLLGHVPSGGASPRHILLHDGRLFVAHEQGGTVAVFTLDDDGRPMGDPTVVPVPGAAFLFAPSDRGERHAA